MGAMHHPIYLIAAVDKQMGLGKNGRLAWHLKKELAYFHDLTMKTREAGKRNMVVMGRTTWESIPEKYRPLPGRMNVVLSHHFDYRARGAMVVGSLDDAYSLADETIESIFVIGGGKVFAQAMARPDNEGLYLTVIDQDFNCDTFFPPIPDSLEARMVAKDQENGVTFAYYFYQ